MTQEELKLVLEALEDRTSLMKWQMARDAVKEALAQPEQEPWGACVSGRVFVGELPEHVRKLAEDEGLTIQWLYTTPPQRKPLTDEEIDVIDEATWDEDHNSWGIHDFARAIEAAHGIKENT